MNATDDNAIKVKTLLEVRKKISSTLLELRHDLESVRASKKLSVGVILTCAENIQVALKAPPKWKVGLPLYFSHPPTISTEEMRRGKLAEYNKRENQTKVTLADDQAIVDNIQAYVHVVEPGDVARKALGALSKREGMLIESTESKYMRASGSDVGVSSSGSSSSAHAGGVESAGWSQSQVQSLNGDDNEAADESELAAQEIEAAQIFANRKRAREAKAEAEAEAEALRAAKTVPVAAVAPRKNHQQHKTDFLNFGFETESEEENEEETS